MSTEYYRHLQFSRGVHTPPQFAVQRTILLQSSILINSHQFSSQNFGSKLGRRDQLHTSSNMALPVLCGPNRCALVHNQDKQPLIELSLRVNLPVVELLQALGQVAPRATEPALSRPSLAHQRGNTHGSGAQDTSARKQERPLPPTWAGWYPNSDWQPAFDPQTSDARHSWEPCPPAQSAGWDHQHASLAQKEEQMQLLWALTDRTGTTHQSEGAKAPRARTLRKPLKATRSPPRSEHPPKGPVVVSKAKPIQNMPQPQETRRTSADGSEEFDPPARPGARPKKCPVQ